MGQRNNHPKEQKNPDVPNIWALRNHYATLFQSWCESIDVDDLENVVTLCLRKDIDVHAHAVSAEFKVDFRDYQICYFLYEPVKLFSKRNFEPPLEWRVIVIRC